MVLTQACDLAQDKTTRVVVAPVHEAAELVARNILKAGAIRDQVRRGQVFGWYFLPAASAPINLAESIVDLRELHTIERRTLEYLVGAGKRVCRIRTPCIGDCQTAALVGRDGSIDWLCLPRFDSGACFAALLGTPEHGRWLLRPAGEVRAIRRRYRDGTLVLETDFETDDGAVAVIDCMPLREPARRTSCASSRAGAARCRCAWSWSSASTTARSCRGCSASTAASRPSPAPTRCACTRRRRRCAART